MNLVRVVVATSGRNFRRYVGRLPGGRSLYGGPRPIEQIWAISAILAAAALACLVSRQNAVSIFGIAAALAVVSVAGLSQIKYDGIPITHKMFRLAALLVHRPATVVAPEELGRQSAANPHAFLIADNDPTELTNCKELQ